MSTTVEKTMIEVYRIHYLELGIRSDISVEVWEAYSDCKALKISISGDHINGSHVFSVGDVSKFLKDIDFDYTMRKIDLKSLEEYDYSEWLIDLKKDIIRQRREYRFTGVSKSRSRDAWREITDSFSDYSGSLDLIYKTIMETDLYKGDICSVPSCPTAYTTKALNFWKHIWVPFVGKFEEVTLNE